MATETREEKQLSLPDRTSAEVVLKEIRAFQQVCQEQMIKGHDYGVIPGTQKPTLLKPGAEKIIKLMRPPLRPFYIVEKAEDWEKGFFSYTVKCQLFFIGTDILVDEGLGNCNSYESKYRYRWVFPSEMERMGLTKENRPMRWILTKKGNKAPVYRVENEDIFSQVNTILKMAKKRALVDAALSVGRLSDVFTQDIEDAAPDTQAQEAPERPAEVGEEPPVPQTTEPPAEATPKPNGEAPGGKKGSRKAELLALQIQNKGDLFNAAMNHFTKSRAQVIKAVGVATQEQITDVAQAWATLVELYA